MEQNVCIRIPLWKRSYFEYHLSTGFDISTASYDSNFSLTNIGAMDIAFNTDGTKMFVSGSYYGNGLIFEYHLSTGFDISTASYDSNFSLTNIGAMDIAFNTDGTKCLYQDPIMETVLFFEYHLSTGFDVSTASYHFASPPFVPSIPSEVGEWT